MVGTLSCTTWCRWVVYLYMSICILLPDLDEVVMSHGTLQISISTYIYIFVHTHIYLHVCLCTWLQIPTPAYQSTLLSSTTLARWESHVTHEPCHTWMRYFTHTAVTLHRSLASSVPCTSKLRVLCTIFRVLCTIFHVLFSIIQLHAHPVARTRVHMHICMYVPKKCHTHEQRHHFTAIIHQKLNILTCMWDKLFFFFQDLKCFVFATCQMHFKIKPIWSREREERERERETEMKGGKGSGVRWWRRKLIRRPLMGVWRVLMGVSSFFYTRENERDKAQMRVSARATARASARATATGRERLVGMLWFGYTPSNEFHKVKSRKLKWRKIIWCRYHHWCIDSRTHQRMREEREEKGKRDRGGGVRREME